MKLQRFVDEMEKIAPLRYAESWDNVGLLVGDPAAEVSRAILTIDYTPAVAAEVAETGADLVLAYHPTIFHPLKKLGPGSLVYQAIRSGVAIYSPHTALDAADGGTNDMLADVLGLTDRQPLKSVQQAATQYKLVTFIPEHAIEKVSAALFDAGAGRIGNYTRCSFQNPGTGTFFGEEQSHPTVGQRGRMESAAEIRLETVLPIDLLQPVVSALRSSHPYEQPAFDLVQLAAAPESPTRGMGRIGTLKPLERRVLIERIKSELGLPQLLVSGPLEGTVGKAACCAGACGDFLDEAIAQGAGLYLTGEIRHHDALKAANAGLTVVCTLHSNSERAVLRRLASRLAAALPGLTCLVSQQDRDPFSIL